MNIVLFPCHGKSLLYARRCFQTAQAEGAIPANRSSLSGDETVLIARRATQDRYLNLGISVFYEPEPELLWLDLLYVEPEFRRQNIGFSLVEATRNFAVEQRYGRLSLGTMPGNHPMLSLMRRAPGFFSEVPTKNRDAVFFSEGLGRRAVR